jgi:hypothetical protein
MVTSVVRTFLVVEAAVFGSAALVHAGLLVHGYEHRPAGTAESLIALVLLAGLIGSLVAPRSSRVLAQAAQGLALAGTLVGLATIVIGIGPRTLLDVTLHVAMVGLLVTGLVMIGRRANVPQRHVHPH